MKTRCPIVLLLLAFALSSGGCSHFSRGARQTRAYNRYIQKSSVARVRQSQKFRNTGTSSLPPMPSEREREISTSSGPESVSSGSE